MATDTKQELREAPPPEAATNPNITPQPNLPPGIEELQNPLEFVAGLPNVGVYKGDTKKMNVFNNGENGQDKAVQFQLKMGVHKDSFALTLDSKDSDRVINLDDSRRIDTMSQKDLDSVVLLQKQGDKLDVSKNNQTWQIDQENLIENPLVIPLDETTGVEIRDFDPNQNSITIHKVKLNLVPPEIILSPSNKPEAVPTQKTDSKPWSNKLIDIIGIPTIAAATAAAILSGGDSSNQDVTTQPPIERQVTSEVLPIEQSLHESLQCPATTEYEIKEGDFLTKALVDVNGLDRYEDASGKLDLQQLYGDLSCLLSIPENLQVLEKSDPIVASAIKNLFEQGTVDTIGPATADRIYDVLKKLNEGRQKEFPNGSSQLVISYEGDLILVPNFTENRQSFPPFPEETPHPNPQRMKETGPTPEPKEIKPITPPTKKAYPLEPPPTFQPETPHSTPTKSPDIPQEKSV